MLDHRHVGTGEQPAIERRDRRAELERLGGLDAITVVVDSFVARCAGDGRINRKFAPTDAPHPKKNLVDQLWTNPTVLKFESLMHNRGSA